VRRAQLGLDPIIDAAVRLLNGGGVVALPTETVYGLAADAGNAAAVRRIFTIKGRPADHPLIVHLSKAADLACYAADNPPALHRLAELFWPGPLTLIVRKTPLISDIVTAGQPTVALRVVDHPVTQAILEQLGRAVAAPSANRFGRVSPTTAQHVRDDLGDAVDLIIDGGPARIGVESTIVDLSGPTPAILRAGMIGASALGDALGQPVITRQGGDVRAPGMLASHYAPRAPLVLVDARDIAAETARRSARGERVGILTLPADAAVAARTLYATLRALDAAEFDVLIASLPDDIEANAAVRDRLKRAASSGSITFRKRP
jgi:L-threonylcarbamoyladenylate synthase